jgi:phosphoglycolate phosphatase
LKDSFLRFGIPEAELDNAVEFYRKHYLAKGQFENFPYPGIREVLEKLKADGHKLYVATSKPEAMSQNILKNFDLAKYFDIICGATMGTNRSSKAAVIEYLLSQTGKSGEIIMVGDTAYDVIGAKAHNIPTIGVSWGYGEVSDMEAAGAAAIAHTMDELYAHLR